VIKYFFVLLLCFHTFAKSTDDLFFKKVFPKAHNFKFISIDDSVDEAKTNNKLGQAFDKGDKILGYFRDIVTSTGCNSGCLPVVFTLFFDSKAKFIKLLSKEGLTKKDHAPFTADDYMRLELILLQNPDSFKMVGHPKDMVDALTSETLKSYQADVVAKAAYTSLRVNLYYQETLSHLKILLKSK
jgi:hypothetical protein